MSTTEFDSGTGEVVKVSAKGGRTRAPEGLAVQHLSVAERVERGRAARSEAPRASHGEYTPAADRAG